MIANSTLNTTVKIIRTGQPVFLSSRFKLNGRGTAYLQPVRKGISCEGFVNRAITLLNKAGPRTFESNTVAGSKKKIKAWVSENINIKPKPSVKNHRFTSRLSRNDGSTQDEEENSPTEARNNGQRMITDFFRRN